MSHGCSVRKGELYRLDFLDGKSYIGASVRGAVQRYKEHHLAVLSGSSCPVHIAWRELGPPVLIILKSGVLEKDLWLEEKKATSQLLTLLPYGYNCISSGVAPGGLDNKHTLQTRKQMSTSHLGKQQTEETKSKISLAHLGKKATLEHRANNSKSHLGKKATPEAKEHNRQAQLRRYQINPVSDEERERCRQRALKQHRDNPVLESQREKMRQAHRNNPNCGMGGKKHSEETLNKMRTSALKREADKRDARLRASSIP
jgi:hypothetical protein